MGGAVRAQAPVWISPRQGWRHLDGLIRVGALVPVDDPAARLGRAREGELDLVAVSGPWPSPVESGLGLAREWLRCAERLNLDVVLDASAARPHDGAGRSFGAFGDLPACLAALDGPRGARSALAGFLLADHARGLDESAAEATRALRAAAPHLLPCAWQDEAGPASLARHGNPMLSPRLALGDPVGPWTNRVGAYLARLHWHARVAARFDLVLWPVIELGGQETPCELGLALHSALALGAQGVWFAPSLGPHAPDGGPARDSLPLLDRACAARWLARSRPWRRHLRGRAVAQVFAPSWLTDTPGPVLAAPGRLVERADEGLLISVLVAGWRPPALLVVDVGDPRARRPCGQARLRLAPGAEPLSASSASGRDLVLRLPPGGAALVRLRPEGGFAPQPPPHLSVAYAPGSGRSACLRWANPGHRVSAVAAALAADAAVRSEPSRIARTLTACTAFTADVRLRATRPLTPGEAPAIALAWSYAPCRAGRSTLACTEGSELTTLETVSPVPWVADRLRAQAVLDGAVDTPYVFTARGTVDPLDAMRGEPPRPWFRLGVGRDPERLWIALRTADAAPTGQGDDTCATLLLHAGVEPWRSMCPGGGEGCDCLRVVAWPARAPGAAQVAPDGAARAVEVATRHGASRCSLAVGIASRLLDRMAGEPCRQIRLNVEVSVHDGSAPALLRFRPDWASPESYDGSGTFGW